MRSSFMRDGKKMSVNTDPNPTEEEIRELLSHYFPSDKVRAKTPLGEKWEEICAIACGAFAKPIYLDPDATIGDLLDQVLGPYGNLLDEFLD